MYNQKRVCRAISILSEKACESTPNPLYICMNESGVQAASGTLDTVEISNELSRMKAQKHKFAYYDPDDISQEIWLSVNKSAKKFDPERVPEGKRTISFFNVASENAIKNLKRDNRVIDNVNLGDTPVIREDISVAGELRAREMRDFIMDRLPPKLQEPFKRMIEYGGEGVSQYIKTKIRTTVLRILEEFNE